MYFGIVSRLLILLIVINYGYAKMYNDDLMDYIITNKTISNVFNIVILLSNGSIKYLELFLLRSSFE